MIGKFTQTTQFLYYYISYTSPPPFPLFLMDYFSIFYGTSVILGGGLGFLKARSVISLASGLIFGTAILVGANKFANDQNDYQLLLFSTFGLFAIMGFRFWDSAKLMPAGIVFGLSGFELARLFYRLYMNSQSKQN
ncbi:hypothetical protein SNEBB_007847 [Seison nebaliae]|nr:hypothetical protein SNEBB_007847 [Seison nebaliae]